MAMSPADAKQEATSLLADSRALLREAKDLRDKQKDILAVKGPEADRLEERIRDLLQQSKRLSNLAKKLVS